MKRVPLSQAELDGMLSNDLRQWQLVDGAIQREFQFADFRSAFAFLAFLALHSERLDHHAELWNVYNRVRVRLSTHEPPGISTLDVELAQVLDGYVVGR